MKVTPIIFSAPMVRALIDGRKWQTRRIVKPQPSVAAGFTDMVAELPSCPYGRRGDLLWARETWSNHYTQMEGLPFHYRADLPADPSAATSANHAFGLMQWKPSIHMPRRASRLTLELTGICVERLKAINEGDAVAEGCASTAVVNVAGDDYTGLYAHEHFAKLWESLHGPGSWDANPWCWRLSFNVHQVNIDAFLKARYAA